MEEKMKDSGIKWIGQIPESWDIVKIKYNVNIFTGNSIADNDKENYEDCNDAIPYIATKDINVNSHKIDYENGMYIKKDDKSFKRAPGNSSLLCIEGGSAGRKVAFTDKPVCFVNKLCCFTSRRMDNKFLFYTINSYSFKEAFNQNIFGLIGGVSTEKIKNIKITAPSIEEQKQIAEFLDKKCADIDEIIVKTEEQIETLEQYKKSLITETVTKGLRKSLVKDSEVKWIGEIPCNWKTKKIKYVATLKGRIGWQGLTSDEYQDEGPYLITGIDFENGGINWNSCVHIPEKRWVEAVDIRIKNNDLLITKDGTVGKVALVEGLNQKASLNSGVLLINLEDDYSKKYLFWVLQSDIFWKWFSYTNSGNSTIIHLYQHDFDNFEYPIPSIEEQNEISDYLDKQCKKTDEIISKQKESMETLKQYKQSLIYEYVTGKKRV